MKKALCLMLGIIMCVSLAVACGGNSPAASEPPAVGTTENETLSAEPAADETVTYTYQGAFGEETCQFALKADGTAEFNIPGNEMIADVYAGTYTKDGSTVTIAGLKNKDKSSEYQEPGLWDWIEPASGNAAITLNGDGTFTPVGGDSSTSGETPPATNAELTDIAYGADSESQKLDLYMPEGEGSFPLVILFHGGGFTIGDKTMSPISKLFALTKSGYAVASVEYRLSGEAFYPAAVDDAKAAVEFFLSKGKDYNIDTSKIAVGGESAGAYLAARAAFSLPVAALIDFYGPMQFDKMDADFAALGVTEEQRKSPLSGGLTNSDDSFESKFMGKNIGMLDDAEKKDIDAIALADSLPPAANLKVFIRHGDADASVPYAQSERLRDALKVKLGDGNVNYELVPGAAHMDDMFYTEIGLKQLTDFLDGVIK
ncbi:MAG: alpha/beta hydrolase [Clostridiales bacterium]|nr:alpha/beta hydrolase [Clostridiales bacterium]